MYYKFDKADIIIVIIYVDDVLFMGSNPKLMKKEKGKFMKVWESRDLGKAKEYLGMHITCDRKKRTLTLDQCIYAEKVLKQFRMQNAKPTWTPFVENSSRMSFIFSSLHKHDLISVVEYCSFSLVTTL